MSKYYIERCKLGSGLWLLWKQGRPYRRMQLMGEYASWRDATIAFFCVVGEHYSRAEFAKQWRLSHGLSA